eukprot:Rmarinus@m.7217
MASFRIQGDGFIDGFYHYLWVKNDENMTCPHVAIPDTVVFKYQQPAYWYFTSAIDGQVKMKNKSNLNSAKIYESFTKNSHKLPSNIIAYYIHNKTNSEGKAYTTIEYFDKEGLYNFLHLHRGDRNGVLQKFIYPKSERNDLLRVVWSPNVCVLERRVNLRRQTDDRYSMYERSVTFEGAEHHSECVPVNGNVLPAHLQMVLQSIIRHISNQRFKVSRMVLNFKLDQNDRLWFLWTSSLRIQQWADDEGTKEVPPVNLEPAFLAPDSERHKPVTVRPFGYKKGVMAKGLRCPSCRRQRLVDQMCVVNYATVISQHQKRLRAARSRDEASRTELAGREEANLAALDDDSFMATLQADRSLASDNATASEIHGPRAREGQETMVGGVSMEASLGSSDTAATAAKRRKGRSVCGKQTPIVTDVNDLDQRTSQLWLHDEGDAEDLSNDSSDDNYTDERIPPLLRRLHRQMSYETFCDVRDDPAFAYKTTHVCEKCFMLLTKDPVHTMPVAVPKRTKPLWAPFPRHMKDYVPEESSELHRRCVTSHSAVRPLHSSCSIKRPHTSQSFHRVSREPRRPLPSLSGYLSRSSLGARTLSQEASMLSTDSVAQGGYGLPEPQRSMRLVRGETQSPVRVGDLYWVIPQDFDKKVKRKGKRSQSTALGNRGPKPTMHSRSRPSSVPRAATQSPMATTQSAMSTPMTAVTDISDAATESNTNTHSGSAANEVGLGGVRKTDGSAEHSRFLDDIFHAISKDFSCLQGDYKASVTSMPSGMSAANASTICDGMELLRTCRSSKKSNSRSASLAGSRASSRPQSRQTDAMALAQHDAEMPSPRFDLYGLANSRPASRGSASGAVSRPTSRGSAGAGPGVSRPNSRGSLGGGLSGDGSDRDMESAYANFERVAECYGEGQVTDKNSLVAVSPGGMQLPSSLLERSSRPNSRGSTGGTARNNMSSAGSRKAASSRNLSPIRHVSS